MRHYIYQRILLQHDFILIVPSFGLSNMKKLIPRHYPLAKTLSTLPSFPCVTPNTNNGSNTSVDKSFERYTVPYWLVVRIMLTVSAFPQAPDSIPAL